MAVLLFTTPAMACDKQQSIERLSKTIATGHLLVPQKSGEGFSVEVKRSYWKDLGQEQKQELAAEISCAVDTSLVVFMVDGREAVPYRSNR